MQLSCSFNNNSNTVTIKTTGKLNYMAGKHHFRKVEQHCWKTTFQESLTTFTEMRNTPLH